MAKLTARQERFVHEYLIDLNATQAAIRAGYSTATADQQGSRLLANVKVRARVDELLAERSKRTGINADRVVRELARLAFVNADNLINFSDATISACADEDDLAAISSVRVKRFPAADGGEGVEREVKLADKLKALELLGKHLGMFTDRVDVTGGLNIIFRDDYGEDVGPDG